MTKKCLLGFTLLATVPAMAQLAPPNAAGVTVGQVNLIVKDVEAQTRFWTDMVGGKVVKNANVREIQFPGVFIFLTQGDPAGPSDQTVVNHFGFVLKDLPTALAKWRAAGLAVTQSAYNPNQGGVAAPEGIHLEVFGDPDLPVPVQMNHFHMHVVKDEIPRMQEWYAKVFGAVPGTRSSVARPGNIVITDDLPGQINLSMSPPSPKPMAPSKGYTIDHIGFEVKDLAVFCKDLAAKGIMLDEPIHASRNVPHVKLAYITDPWGTRIELTQGLSGGAE